MKKSGASLFSHRIITFSRTKLRHQRIYDVLSIQENKMTSMDENTTEVQTIETTSMESRQLHSSLKEAMKKMAEFSGENNEPDIDEWLFDLTNLFSLMKLNDETKILETMGKLTGPALKWYQEN